jgi:hypothetical protein
MRRLAGIIAIAAAAANAACIKEDTTATWNIDAAGRVHWRIVEQDVRSDAAARGDRVAEEATYLSTVQARIHDAGRGLTRLGASGLKVTIIDATPPYSVVTEGDFTGLDELGQRLITRYGFSGTSQVTRDGSTWTWTFELSDPKAGTSSDTDDATNELGALFGDRLRVLLRDGRFVAATGFTMDADGRVAQLNADDKLEAGDNEMLTLTLCWEVK